LRNQQQKNAIALSRSSNAAPWSQPQIAPRIPAMCILLVEDDGMIRGATAEMLTDMGHSVIDVPTTDQALASLASQTIDVLVTDISLPSGSGIDLAKEAIRLVPTLRVIFASGGDIRQELVGQDHLATAVFLTKPFGEKDLLDALASLQTAVERTSS
jgi:DNA-binding NtrC family response regulator